MDKLEKLAKALGKACKVNEPMANYTTLKIGGPAALFIEAKSEKELVSLIKLAFKNKVPYFLLAGGSNLLISDSGFKGLVIHPKFIGIKSKGEKVIVKAGTPLSTLVDFLIESGLSGMEKMVAIPGTVGGAIYGNAGAYGQTISDTLIRVKVFDSKKVKWVSKRDCGFSYRESVFKKMGAIILEGEFLLTHAAMDVLKTSASGTLKIRQEKYPPGMLCPGSFFKNVPATNLSKSQLSKIPSEKILYGKVPAGYFLETVGAKGARLGDIKIAEYHANLFINLGNGKASDFYRLAEKYQRKVKDKFGIKLEPEVQLLGFDKKL